MRVNVKILCLPHHLFLPHISSSDAKERTAMNDNEPLFVFRVFCYSTSSSDLDVRSRSTQTIDVFSSPSSEIGQETKKSEYVCSRVRIYPKEMWNKGGKKRSNRWFPKYAGIKTCVHTKWANTQSYIHTTPKFLAGGEWEWYGVSMENDDDDVKSIFALHSIRVLYPSTILKLDFRRDLESGLFIFNNTHSTALQLPLFFPVYVCKTNWHSWPL